MNESTIIEYAKSNKEATKTFLNYVNRYGYFHKGILCVDFEGKTYNVAGVMKTLRLLGLI